MLKKCSALLALLLVVNASWAQSRVPYIPETEPDTTAECSARDPQCTPPDATDQPATKRTRRSEIPSIRVAPERQPERTSDTLSSERQRLVQPQPDRPTEFQQFVEDSLGKRIPLFGYNLFQSVPSTFAPVDRIPVPSSYVVGPGDELLIRAWGQIDVDARVVVDRNGQIYLPKVGSVSVAGVTYDQLTDHMKAAVGRVFRNFDLRVTLGRLRSIQVFVVGYARRPGSYTVGSLSTLVNALFASGGPSPQGSMRHIQLKRGDRVVSDFDIYDLLLKGDKSKDAVLQPGDVIYIPPVGPQIAVSGSVNFPAIYELHSTATLGEEIDFAGGLSSVADGQRVIVERIEGRVTRKLEEFELNREGLAREVHDGDLVRVFSVSPKFENAVTLRGNVAEPGRYPFKAGMRVRDIIPNREFLLTRSFWNHQNAIGTVARNEDERLGTGKTSETLIAEDERSVGLQDRDAVNETTPLDLKRNLNHIQGQADLRNNVKRSAPEINWDYAVVQRLNPVDLSTALIPFNLRKAILDGDEKENLPLQAGDVITIFSQRDIAVPLEHQSKFVRLEGEFRAPGVYKVAPGETLRSLVERAGGLTDKAYIFGTQFTRESARDEQQASLDAMTRDLEMEARHQVVLAAARADQQQNIQAQLESQRALVDKLRQVKATGRVVLEIKPSDAGVDAFPVMALEDGDAVMVPHKPSIVSVVGSVYNQTSFLFHENSRIGNYLKLAGSGNRDSDMKHAFVIRADGSVLSRRSTSGLWSGSLENLLVLPGDTIVVPAQLEKGSTMRAFKDWSQLFSQLALGVAAINVLK
jgi:protein involved in polysaccharide export with SLBB domain